MVTQHSSKIIYCAKVSKKLLKSIVVIFLLYTLNGKFDYYYYYYYYHYYHYYYYYYNFSLLSIITTNLWPILCQERPVENHWSILFYSILFYSAMPQVSIIDFSSLNIAFFLQSQCADVHDRECVCARMQTLPSVLHLSST